MFKKALLALPLLGGAVPALAQSTSYEVPQAVTTAITDVGAMSSGLAGSAGPAVLTIAGPWLAIGVIFFLIGVAWSFFRGRRK